MKRTVKFILPILLAGLAAFPATAQTSYTLVAGMGHMSNFAYGNITNFPASAEIEQGVEDLGWFDDVDTSILMDINFGLSQRRLVQDPLTGEYLGAQELEAGSQYYYSSFYSQLIAVRGNCDRFYEYGNIPFPPISKELELYGRKVIITHGDRLSFHDFALSEGELFISGHTHVPYIEERNGIYFSNPGSPSRPRSSSGPTCVLFFPDCLSILSLLDFTILRTIAFSHS